MTRMIEAFHAVPGTVINGIVITTDGEESVYTLPSPAFVAQHTGTSSHPLTQGKPATVLDVRYEDTNMSDRWIVASDTILRVLTPEEVEAAEAEHLASITPKGEPPTLRDLMSNEVLMAYGDGYIDASSDYDRVIDHESAVVAEALTEAGLEPQETWDEIRGWADVQSNADSALWLSGAAGRLAGLINSMNSGHMGDASYGFESGKEFWEFFTSLVDEAAENGA